jgi:hypothetical protein
VDTAPRNDIGSAPGAIADPLQEALRLRAIARRKNTLTPAESRQYAAAIAAIRGEDDDPERLQKWIARRLDMTRGRVAQILSRHRALTTAREGAAA